MQLVHEWYPSACCGEKDCKIVDCAEILLDNGVYYYHGLKSTVLTAINTSPDGLCHMCFNWGEGLLDKVLKCIFLPLGMS